MKKKTEFNAFVYDFSVKCDDIAVYDIFNIHKYLIKKVILNKNVWIY